MPIINRINPRTDQPADLFAVGVSLPEGDAVLLGHVAALRQHLGVGDHLLSGLALLQENCAIS